MDKQPRTQETPAFAGQSIWNDLQNCMPRSATGEFFYEEQIALEREVLTAAVWGEKALPYVMDQLELDDFSTPVFRQTFKIMRDRFIEGEPITATLLRPLIHEMAYAGISDPTTTYVSQLRDHCKQLRENTRIRNLRSLGERLVTERPDDLEQLLEEGMASLVRRDGFRGLDLAVAGNLAMKAREQGSVTKKMVDLPWGKVNSCTRGLHAGWLCLVAGRPGHGKTAAAIELALSAAKQGKTVLFVTLEMDAQELFVRVAQRFGMDSEHYYMGGMDERDWNSLEEATNFPYLKNIRVEYAETVAKITALIRSVRPDLVVIDYVQLILHDHKDRVEGMTKTSHALKAMSRRYNVPIVGLSQLSRAAKDQRGKIPNLGDLRDSGALEQDADQVIFVWQHEDPNHHIVTGQGVFVVAKARMGKVGKQAFRFNGVKQQFEVE